MRKITAEEVKQSAIEKGITRVDHHRCGCCEVMVRYYIAHGNLFFDPSCGCSDSREEPREWWDAAEWINMQSTDEHQKEVAAKFGLVL